MIQKLKWLWLLLVSLFSKKAKDAVVLVKGTKSLAKYGMKRAKKRRELRKEIVTFVRRVNHDKQKNAQHNFNLVCRKFGQQLDELQMKKPRFDNRRIQF